jgi:hypothetical protein
VYERLRTPDRRTLSFSPYGLSSEFGMKPEASADFLESALAKAELIVEVPEDLVGAFNRLNALFLHGLFDYEFFTVAMTHASLVTEMALGLRFLAAYPLGIPLVNSPDGNRALLAASDYGAVVNSMSPKGSHPFRSHRGKPSWRLEGEPRFDASFNSLLQWAYGRGLLKNWLDAEWERQKTNARPGPAAPSETAARTEWEAHRLELIRDIRNLLAHPTYHQVAMPPDAARAVVQAAAITNSLWIGVQTDSEV